jgi:hypothetical protein
LNSVANRGNLKRGIYGMEPMPPVSLQIVDERSTEVDVGKV